MVTKCSVCDKSRQTGIQHTHKHSKKWKFRAQRTKRDWKVNIRTVKLEGIELTMCMSCYKKYKKEGLNYLNKKGFDFVIK